MIYSPKKIGELIRDTRRRLGFTQRQLSKKSGTGLRFVIELEKGKPTCQLGKTLTVLHALGIALNPSHPAPKASAPKSGSLKIKKQSPKPSISPETSIPAPDDPINPGLND